VTLVGNPMVSICLPTFNGERFLGVAIESVLSQTFSDFELIICDDCSHDSSVSLIRAFAEKDSRIKFFQNEKNCGLFENYNVCLGHVSGQFVKLFAQDDLLESQCLESMVAVLEQRPAVNLVSCGRRWIDEKGLEIDRFKLFDSDLLLSAKKSSAL